MDTLEIARTFIAVDVDAKIKGALSALVSGIKSDVVRPVAVEHMHITLAFLGDIDNDSAKELGRLISAIECRQFSISLNGLGTFSTKRPGPIFAKVMAGAAELELVHSYILKGTHAIGIDLEERKFTPHMTVARVRNAAPSDMDDINSFVAARAGDEFGSFACKEIKLKGSTPTPKGPVYKDLFVGRLPA